MPCRKCARCRQWGVGRCKCSSIKKASNLEKAKAVFSMFIWMYFVFFLLVFTYSSKGACGSKSETDSKVNSQATEIVILDKKTQLAKLVLEIRKDRKEEKAMESFDCAGNKRLRRVPAHGVSLERTGTSAGGNAEAIYEVLAAQHLSDSLPSGAVANGVHRVGAMLEGWHHI